jgi:hypothetical protein
VKSTLALGFAIVIAFGTVPHANAQSTNMLWSWDQATGATKFGAFDPKLRLFLGCGERQAVRVPRRAPMQLQPGKACADGSIPRIYGAFLSAGALFVAARRDSGLTAGKRAFFRFLLSQAGAAYLNAARENDEAQMFMTLQTSGLKGTTVPGTTTAGP